MRLTAVYTAPYLSRILSVPLLCLASVEVLTISLRAQTAGISNADSAITQAIRLIQDGNFSRASELLHNVSATASPTQRERIDSQLDLMHRIRLDYLVTTDDLFNSLQSSIRGLTRTEFDQWMNQGRFDSRMIDGARWFMNSSEANLFCRYSELVRREISPDDQSHLQRAILESGRAIKAAALRSHQPYVLPKQFDVNMVVSADINVADDGSVIRAWLPVPRAYPYQNDFQIIASSPVIKQIAPEDWPIRSVYFEHAAMRDQPTIFKLHYRFTHAGVWFDVDPNRVMPVDRNDPRISPFLREEPHVVFTPAMRVLSEKIVDREKNPAVIAKKIYEWIGAHIDYSFSIEYSTISNLSEYCRAHGYGDCGEEAMLFITLCRLNHIPARWQSGWDTFPGQQDIHDWSEIYLAPYGWVPVDPYMSVMSKRYMTTLISSEQKEIRDFYFGGLDQYRMAANGDHSQPLVPAKISPRSDNIDFQRGELECDGQNIYFDHFNYQLNVRDITKTSTP